MQSSVHDRTFTVVVLVETVVVVVIAELVQHEAVIPQCTEIVSAIVAVL